MDEHRQLSQVGESGRNVKLSPSKETRAVVQPLTCFTA